jgi:hypothetical protein
MKHVEFLKKCQNHWTLLRNLLLLLLLSWTNICSETESVASQLDSREAVLKQKEIVALDLVVVLDLLLSLSLHSKSAHKMVKIYICFSLRDA